MMEREAVRRRCEVVVRRGVGGCDGGTEGTQGSEQKRRLGERCGGSRDQVCGDGSSAVGMRFDEDITFGTVSCSA